MIIPTCFNLPDEFYRIMVISVGFIFLYAEIHFRLPLIRGRLYRKKPEILFDLPRRVETGQLPILIFIKDADKFPVFVEKAEISIGDKSVNFPIMEEVSSSWWHRVLDVDVRDFTGQEISVRCKAYVKIGRKKPSIVVNDNLPTLPHQDFSCYVDGEKLPLPDGWIAGDIHCHSNYTEDQIEFGAPPEAIPPMARHIGISFCGLLEHSYDLDDLDGSWVHEDPELLKWQKYLHHVEKVNKENPDFILLHGEEVSVDNGFGKNVHMGVLNSRTFFRGTGDSMENRLGRNPDFHFAQIADQVPDNALCFAAHPLASAPKIQQILIKRGKWDTESYHKNIDGWQISNGNGGDGLEAGKAGWINHLLCGRYQRIFAGNDAHGSFNRFQAVLLPMLKIFEKDQQVFGQHLTFVKSPVNISRDQLVQNLKTNPSIISSGPFCEIQYSDITDNIHEIGSVITNKNGLLKISARSTQFFGTLKSVELFCGNVCQRLETSVFRTDLKDKFDFKTTIRGIKMPQKGYLRLEVSTQKQHFAFSNPIWIELTV